MGGMGWVGRDGGQGPACAKRCPAPFISWFWQGDSAVWVKRSLAVPELQPHLLQTCSRLTVLLCQDWFSLLDRKARLEVAFGKQQNKLRKSSYLAIYGHRPVSRACWW